MIEKFRTLRRQLWRDWRSRLGIIIILFMFCVGLTAPLLASSQPIVCRHEGEIYFPAVVEALQNIPLLGDLFEKSKPFNYPGFDAKQDLDRSQFALWPLIPYGPLEAKGPDRALPSSSHWLGTDNAGRDVAARLIHGTYVSVKVGLCSMLIAGMIGTVIGAIAGLAGGWTDKLLSRLIEVVICFPAFLLILSVMVWFEPDINYVILIIGLTHWTAIARLTRAEFIRLKTADFVAAAVSSGEPSWRILLYHILPCAVAPVLVTLTFGVADAVLIEAGLSWLGFGVPAPDPSWGNMLRGACDNIRSAPFLVCPPCIAVIISVIAYQLVGGTLRQRLNPREVGVGER